MARARALALLLCAAALAACSGGEMDLVVRGLRQPGMPHAGLEVTALPVDPDALLDSLAAASRRPKPRFPELDAAMARFRSGEADTTSALRATAAWRAARDSVEAVGDSLRALDRASLAYREAYGRLRALYDRLGQRAAERDRAMQGGLGAERDLAQRAERAADSLRRWEQAAYAEFPTRLAESVRQSGRDVRQLVTDSTGVARFRLLPGRWWIQAHVREPENPFLERYWNVPVRLSRLVPAALPLLDRNAVSRWRH